MMRRGDGGGCFSFLILWRQDLFWGQVLKKRILGHFESFGQVLHTVFYVNRIIPLRLKEWMQMKLSDGLLQDSR